MHEIIFETTQKQFLENIKVLHQQKYCIAETNYFEALKKHSDHIFICQQQIRNSFYIKHGYFGYDFENLYHYSKDSRYCVRQQFEIYDQEDDLIVKTIGDSYRIHYFTADNTTFISYEQRQSDIHFLFHDIINDCNQAIVLKNSTFQTLWKNKNYLYILVKSTDILCLYSLILYENSPILLKTQSTCFRGKNNRFFSELEDLRFYTISERFCRVFSKQNLKLLAQINFSQQLETIKMHENGIFIIQYSYGLTMLKIIQFRMKNKLIRKMLLPSQTKCFILNNYLIKWPNKNRLIWNIIFYDINLGSDILSMTFGQKEISSREIKKALIATEKKFLAKYI